MTKCVYIVQSDNEIPEHYRCIEERIILVSWGSRNQDTTLHAPESTWTTGRNAAVRYIEESGEEYDYVVFLDDDLKFEHMTQSDGFQAFETFLSQQRPVIGVPRCWDYNSKNSNVSAIPDHINRQGLEDIVFDHQPVDWFDACFNAYRWDAFKRILPYDSQFDSSSWYTSQFLAILKANLLYRNKIIQNNRIKIQNTSLIHGVKNHYPRGVGIFGEAYEYFLEQHGIKNIRMSRNVQDH